MFMNAVFDKILNSEFLKRANLPGKGYGRSVTVVYYALYYGPLWWLPARVSNGVGRHIGGLPPRGAVPLSAVVTYRG